MNSLIHPFIEHLIRSLHSVINNDASIRFPIFPGCLGGHGQEQGDHPRWLCRDRPGIRGEVRKPWYFALFYSVFLSHFVFFCVARFWSAYAPVYSCAFFALFFLISFCFRLSLGFGRHISRLTCWLPVFIFFVYLIFRTLCLNFYFLFSLAGFGFVSPSLLIGTCPCILSRSPWLSFVYEKFSCKIIGNLLVCYVCMQFCNITGLVLVSSFFIYIFVATRPKFGRMSPPCFREFCGNYFLLCTMMGKFGS